MLGHIWSQWLHMLVVFSVCLFVGWLLACYVFIYLLLHLDIFIVTFKADGTFTSLVQREHMWKCLYGSKLVRF